MKTLVDASSAYIVAAGIGRYARNILEYLLAHGDEDEWVLAHTRPAKADPTYWSAPPLPHVRDVEIPVSRRNADRMWHRLRVPLDLRLFTGRGDVLYSPDFMAPPTAGMPRMITVHDLAFMTHPEYTTPGMRSFLAGAVPRQVHNARKIAVVSHAARQDLVDLLKVPEEKIVVARNGVDGRFLNATSLDPERRLTLGLPDRYFLMVGTIEPRKNHLNTLSAFERTGLGTDIPLLLAGRAGWAYEEALEKARDLARRGMVRMLDYVPERDLPGLYAGAQAVLYPSIAEGFGLPIVEALATGTPVLTGTAPALREVGGDQAVYANPLDVEELTSRIRDLAEGDPAADYGKRDERREWARTFSWGDSGATVLRSLVELSAR